EVNKWLEEMMKAAENAAAAGDTGNSKIGDVASAAAGTKADDASVKGIALGIKGIVDAAGKASGEDGGALKGVEEATDKNNADAGKLFDTSAGGQQANAAAVGKASDAVSAVSGK
ncbi:variable large family protein, partial [Borreliella garinii]|uniref:variable large family protein n=1 Tax=Borreliella garinii TaxID=29519 RepID=UPI001AEEC44D